MKTNLFSFQNLYYMYIMHILKFILNLFKRVLKAKVLFAGLCSKVPHGRRLLGLVGLRPGGANLSPGGMGRVSF